MVNLRRAPFFILGLILATTLAEGGINDNWAACSLPKCNCSQRQASHEMLVDCQATPNIDGEQLSEELDILLSSTLTYGHLKSFSIVNTPLTHVPRSICRLTTLVQLHLDYNRLVGVPDDCLTNLSNLVNFTASNNAIKELQDGLFDGLRKLEFLNLKRNSIASIGLSVFAVSSNLSVLFTIDLSENKLTNLEPWPYFRGLIGSFQRMVSIYLNNNSISKLTNEMGWEGGCWQGIPYEHLDLSHNKIFHYMDFVNGWNMTLIGVIFCYRLRNNEFLNVNVSITERCDCLDYEYYSMVQAGGLHLHWYKQCELTDPITRKVATVYPFETPLILFVCELTDDCPPGCVCVYRPHNSTLHVYCIAGNLTEFPRQLPALPDANTTYKLDFSNNPLLRRLEGRDYLANTSILDVSNCGIESLPSIRVWKDIAKVPKEVNLYGNKITSVPQSLASVKIASRRLNMAGNPWECWCRNKRMSNWFRSIASQLTQDVPCGSPARLNGKNIIEIRSKEFCIDPTDTVVRNAWIKSVSTVASLALAAVLVCILVYRLRVKLYTKWKFHPFDRDECLGEDMDYDVYLSSCSDDNIPAGNAIREELEQRGYRICYPPRNFVGGETIYNNIYNAVVRSKRTVCFVTEPFVQSGYCMEEFEIALHHNIAIKRKKRLIVLMALDSPADLYANDASNTAALRQYLRQYTYIDYTADDWLDNLLYALPLRGMMKDDQQDGQDDDAHMLQ